MSNPARLGPLTGGSRLPRTLPSIMPDEWASTGPALPKVAQARWARALECAPNAQPDMGRAPARPSLGRPCQVHKPEQGGQRRGVRKDTARVSGHIGPGSQTPQCLGTGPAGPKTTLVAKGHNNRTPPLGTRWSLTPCLQWCVEQQKESAGTLKYNRNTSAMILHLKGKHDVEFSGPKNMHPTNKRSPVIFLPSRSYHHQHAQ